MTFTNVLIADNDTEMHEHCVNFQNHCDNHVTISKSIRYKSFTFAILRLIYQY